MEYDPVLYKLNLKLLTKTLCKLLECDQSRNMGLYSCGDPLLSLQGQQPI